MHRRIRVGALGAIVARGGSSRGTGGIVARVAGVAVLAATTTAAAAASLPPFTEEAARRGIDYVPDQVIQFGDGVAFADLDGDGDPDVVVLGAANGRIGLYENDGTGHFTDRSNGIPGLHPLCSGVTAVDVDRDGDLDLHVTRRGVPDRLFRNDGGFAFVDVAMVAGVADTGDGHGAAWADVDGDGWLDVYVCDRDGPNALYMSQGRNGAGLVTFVDEAVARGVDRGNDPSFAAGFLDVDDDGDPDLYLANDHGTGCWVFQNHLFRNDGGVFTDVTDAGTEGCLDAMCVAIGDFDGDGRQDLFSTNTPAGHALMLNRGPRPWVRAEHEAGVAGFAVGWGATFLDVDHDRRLDLFVCHSNGTNRLYLNAARWPAVDASAAMDLDDPAPAYACAAGDVDGDGDLDLLVSARNVPIRLHVNHAGQLERWLRLDVVGRGGPASVTGLAPEPAIGTVVRVRTGALEQVREVRAGTGFKSQDEMRLHVGLGAAAAADEIVVRWPGGDVERRLRHHGSNRIWTVWPPERLGDLDHDGDLDPADAAAFAPCWTGDDPGALVPGCELADLDGDADVDADDALALIELGYLGWTGDCDGDGVPDVVRIASGEAIDADSDGRPDDCPPPSPADLDGDGGVDGDDVAMLLGHWGDAVPGLDLDGDGTVGFGDLLAVLSAWTG